MGDRRSNYIGKGVTAAFLILQLLFLQGCFAGPATSAATPGGLAAAHTAAASPSSASQSPAPSAKLTQPPVSASPSASPSGKTPAASASPGAASPSPSGSLSSQPPKLTQLLADTGLKFESLDCAQLVLVNAEGSDCTLYCYDITAAGVWTLNDAIGTVSGHVGKNGVTSNKHEGDGCTPRGLYGLGFAFGIEAKPDTSLDYRRVTQDSYWVDDPKSAHYNKWVEGTEKSDWNSAEHLIDHTGSYDYAVVVNYNLDPIVPGNGSAIFLHCGSNPTTGCVSIPKSAMLKLLQWLTPSSTPKILIAGG